MALLTDEQREEYRKLVRDHINDYAIERVRPGDDWLIAKQKGQVYRWQFYCSQATLFRTINMAIAHLALDALHDLYMKRPFQIAGLDTDGIAIALGILLVSGYYEDFKDLHMIRVRKERKEYGKLNIIEGIPKRDVPILMVDDLLSSKVTARNAMHALEEEGFEVLDTSFCLVHKVSDTSTTDYTFGEQEHMNVISLFNLRDFELSWDEYISVKKKELEEED